MNVSAMHSVLFRNPYVFSGAVVTSYFAFYTAYDKKRKELVLSNLLDLALVRRGLDWTLVETNKSISLSGLTIMLTSFMREFDHVKKELLWVSMNFLWCHSIYSFYKFYQLSPREILSDKVMKRISIACGSAAQVALSLGYWEQFSEVALALSATVFGVAHFWTMEVDYKYALQVRPYAYLPFPLAAYVLWQKLAA